MHDSVAVCATWLLLSSHATCVKTQIATAPHNRARSPRDDLAPVSYDLSYDLSQDLDDDPVMEHRALQHTGAVNRVRSMPQASDHTTASLKTHERVFRRH